MVENENKDYGLARKFASLGKLTKLESALRAAIESSEVPPSETRKLLKTNSPRQVKNTTVFQFMKNLFNEIGLGKLKVVDKDNFSMTVVDEENPIWELYTDVEGTTCYLIADAISDFFTEDLRIPAEVVELECRNAGDPVCKFKIDLQPLAVYRIALDKLDEQIIEYVKSGKDQTKIAEELEMMEDELTYRIDTLKSFHVLDENMNLTKIGQTYYKYGKSVIDEEKEDFDPPWKTMSDISGKIADTASFAEAISSSLEDESTKEDIKDSDVVNLAKEAETSKSFAQLVSKTVKKPEGESEGDEE
ncbi:MAG: hypothetical protein R6U61_07470 [Thermoplasmata archaeon]